VVERVVGSIARCMRACVCVFVDESEVLGQGRRVSYELAWVSRFPRPRTLGSYDDQLTQKVCGIAVSQQTTNGTSNNDPCPRKFVST
jgi:hypothetical protein